MLAHLDPGDLPSLELRDCLLFLAQPPGRELEERLVVLPQRVGREGVEPVGEVSLHPLEQRGLLLRSRALVIELDPEGRRLPRVSRPHDEPGAGGAHEETDEKCGDDHRADER